MSDLASKMNVARTFLETGQEVMGVATLTQIITEAEQANDKECLIAAYRLRGTALLKMGDKAGAEADGKALLALDPEQAQVNGEFKAKGTEEIPMRRGKC